jgi:hypothetical protein
MQKVQSSSIPFYVGQHEVLCKDKFYELYELISLFIFSRKILLFFANMDGRDGYNNDLVYDPTMI